MDFELNVVFPIKKKKEKNWMLFYKSYIPSEIAHMLKPGSLHIRNFCVMPLSHYMRNAYEVLLFQRNLSFLFFSHCFKEMPSILLRVSYFTGESMGKTSEHLLHQWEAWTRAVVQSSDPMLWGCQADEVVSWNCEVSLWPRCACWRHHSCLVPQGNKL